MITPEDETLSLDGKLPYRSLMPSELSNSRSNMAKSASNISLASLEASEIFNDFAIDITHIEKLVQDSDSIIMEKK